MDGMELVEGWGRLSRLMSCHVVAADKTAFTSQPSSEVMRRTGNLSGKLEWHSSQELTHDHQPCRPTLALFTTTCADSQPWREGKGS